MNRESNRAIRSRVLIGEPDALARRAIASRFQDSFEFTVVAATGDAVELVELGRYFKPELTLLNAGTEGFEGLSICRDLICDNPLALILVLESEANSELELAALWAGSSGVASKADGVDGILEASREVLDGHLPHSDEAMRLLLTRMRSIPESGAGMRPVRSRLTSREWEVLDLLTGDRSTSDIASELFLSSDTVLTHVKNIMRKLEVHTRSDAVEEAQHLRWPGGEERRLKRLQHANRAT